MLTDMNGMRMSKACSRISVGCCESCAGRRDGRCQPWRRSDASDTNYHDDDDDDDHGDHGHHGDGVADMWQRRVGGVVVGVVVVNSLLVIANVMVR